MTRLPGTAVLALALIAVIPAACATAGNMNVSSHVQRGLDITKYRTFDWGPADALPTGDPRLDKDPVFGDYVQGAVEKGLAARGFARADAGQPDLLIHYHASVNERIDVNRTERQYGYCQGSGCDPWIVQYEAGTLVLDFVDARTNRLVWRGWAQESVDDALGNRDRMQRMINEAVTRMLARLPKR
jgi:hypothetical protein